MRLSQRPFLGNLHYSLTTPGLSFMKIYPPLFNLYRLSHAQIKPPGLSFTHHITPAKAPQNYRFTPL